ncbi:helix-turn-helix transcriptional regulator [Kitasatospora nipponensis]|uniref:Helix-turn-helix transcriptional regulator n=1 Tax=Kitasatospora nipponensis TaxID=258049 RepID=A0ABN1VWM2_9ACTN
MAAEAVAARGGAAGEPAGDAPLLGERARDLYLVILREGGRWPMAEVPAQDEEPVRELLDLGLLESSLADACYRAVNPRVVGGRISEDLRSAGTRLLVRAQEMPDLLADLTRAYDATPRSVDRSGEVRHVHDIDVIRRRVDQLFAEADGEILSAQPGGSFPPSLLAEWTRRTQPFLAGGGVGRLLFEPAARSDGPTVSYVLAAAELGARFRVLGESFKRMTIFDRRLVVLPASAQYASAAFVEDPAVVAFLVGLFERDWQRAEPVQWRADTVDIAGLPLPAQVGRMLSQGLTQRAIATRLSLSERTVAGHISRLRELYDAETLFQLGWLMRAATDDLDGEPVR